MPNWVYNTVDGYTKELNEKYGSENKAIDFQKVIPEPEEITNTVSSGFNDIAKKIYKYNQSKDKISSPYNNPLYKEINSVSDRIESRIGRTCIENPDKSLNELSTENRSIDSDYNYYKALYGENKTRYTGNTDYNQVFENYVNHHEDEFAKFKASNKEKPNKYINTELYEQYATLNDMGKSLYELLDKYGYDNWYDWRNANWGVKWNASDIDYDPEGESLKFETPWDIPFPIIAKIAKDNPDVVLEGYSEEESGWFKEYETRDGKVTVTSNGELSWDEDTGETMPVYFDEGLDTFTYEDITKECNDFVNAMHGIKI
jgi:hypothetical protein